MRLTTCRVFHVLKYERGTLVRATRFLSASGTHAGTLGVVFEETDAYGDGNGPMVRFTNGRMQNVYRGDVEVVR